jgi:anti-repressor protein
MTDLIPFDYSGRQVRTITRDGEPWFVAADVCAVLDIKDVRQAVERVDEDDRCQIPVVDGAGRMNPRTWIVSESGLYDLIIRSDKPEARPFRRWITSEVLPAIRKTGRYGAAPVLSAVPDLSGLSVEGLTWLGQIGQALTITTAELSTARQELEAARPKVEYVEAFVDGEKDSALLRVFANQIKVGEQELRAYLLDRKVIYNSPFQRWSSKKQDWVTVNWYHAHSQYKTWFTERDQPKAPRTPDGRVTTTLDITPIGKAKVKRMLERTPIAGGAA